MKKELYFYDLPPKKNQTPFYDRNIRKIPTEGQSTKDPTALFKTVKVNKNKVSLRNCHSQEKLKYT